MGAPGYDDAPLVRIPMDDAAHKIITLVYPYYENPSFLSRQIEMWSSLPFSTQASMNVIVSDDGSPRYPAEDVIKGFLRKGEFIFPIRLFRIIPDVRWNWLAARNLAMKHAEGWCVCTDMDHVVPERTMRTLIYGKFDEGTLYRFSRVESDGEPIHPHPNSFFLRAETFWKIGGYDEALSGHYGTDGDWRRRAVANVPVRSLPDYLVRHEYDGDSSTTHYIRKQPEDAGKKKIIAQRGPKWRPKVLSFPWKEIEL